ncbi:ABC transporter ATP-binding protein [Actinacidiphila glaucinigra]|uniref:ABC transporter ATP-binding protein n=1 Tax=Actinacidiphila glaucinigra TaxID=235986 RepID=UPI003869782D
MSSGSWSPRYCRRSLLDREVAVPLRATSGPCPPPRIAASRYGPGSAVASAASGGADELRARSEADWTSAIVGAASVRATAGTAGGAEPGRSRRDRMGFVFRSFGLLPILTAAENVGVPLRLRNAPRRERGERVNLLLSLVGLEGHAGQRPGEMSGGQQQRVAIARALANRPVLIIADEPTGRLDADIGRAVMELLRAVVHSEGVTALVATHDPQLLALADRVLELRDGTLADSI